MAALGRLICWERWRGRFTARRSSYAQRCAKSSWRLVGSVPRGLVGYDSHLCIDYISKLWYGFASSLQEGRLLETILKAERGVASRGCGS
jgi:hypothetical protein